ncbi:recombinase family protein [Rhizobium sp. SG570]|uniref:recombinase family protein n=1 Tax=Rhizobium sp. SG570 TaxID=2587113 RepID=UPI001446D44B|nr:recombinase family protein [Rhizobium sp. SG570]NKJ40304.1 DNA invertase Pin-like site-specific DNA recombinase [Rhizobium sp. SG570]
MKIGYARVSTEDQSLDLQINALRSVGCDQIFTDFGVSGKGFDRPGLNEALRTVSAGGMLVVWRLDRLGRSLPRLINLVDELGQRHIEFRSLTENIDTSSSGGRLVFHIMGALAEFERSLISERTRAGMEAARKNGKHLGRPPALSSGDIQTILQALSQGATREEIAEAYAISTRTLQRYLTQEALPDQCGCSPMKTKRRCSQ